MKERHSILERMIPEIFKGEEHPGKAVIDRICLHMTLAAAPHKITNVKSIKVDSESIYDKYAPNFTVVKSNTVRMCPLSSAEIRVPWNSTCGHSFERDAVLDYMVKMNYSRCPVIGCNKSLIEKQ